MPIAYTELALDRAGSRRSDPQWIKDMRGRPGTRMIGFWQDRHVVADSGALVGDEVFLGLDGDTAVFAVDLAEPAEAVDVRSLFGTVSADEAATLVYAKGILHWNRNQRFCGTCGAPTESRDGGHLRVCLGDACGRLLFPRIEPAVIALVEYEGRCLLGRHRGAAEGAFATLAGFVEIGESLEDAVRREVAEEAGVTVGEVVYQASQPWPFPSGLMLGFRAEAVSEEINVDSDELQEARWFTPAEVIERGVTGKVDSIGSYLIASWLENAGLEPGKR